MNKPLAARFAPSTASQIWLSKCTTHYFTSPKEGRFKGGTFRTLSQDGIVKVLTGLTSIDEVRANTNG